MIARVAVTGVNGFVGRHLVRELVDAGSEVVGVGHEPVAQVDGLAEYVEQDLTRGWPRGLDVDAVVHLAALSAVGPSFDDPQRYVQDNSAMVTHLCEALLTARAPTRLLAVSSGAVYAPQQHPLPETSPIGFNSPYVVSKVLVENLLAYYSGRGLDAVIARPFNHIGPGQAAGFLVPDLVASADVAVRNGRPMPVGDLGTRRDFTDVRDVVRAYRLLLEADDLGDRVFNVCSGRSRSGRELLEIVQAVRGYGDLRVQVDRSRIRPADPREIVGDNERLRRAVGWRPEVDVASSIRDVIAASPTPS